VLVFSTETCTVLDASVSARVKRPHIMASKSRFRPKQEPRTRTSKKVLCVRPKRWAILAARVVVRVVVVLEYVSG